jgi:hypothetical protein
MEVQKIIEAHKHEIIAAWQKHFGQRRERNVVWNLVVHGRQGVFSEL